MTGLIDWWQRVALDLKAFNVSFKVNTVVDILLSTFDLSRSTSTSYQLPKKLLERHSAAFRLN